MDDHVEIRVLASGSSGNAMFLRFGELRMLVDAGISMRRLNAGLESVGASVEDLDALILTHEHSDHIRGLDRLLSQNPTTPIYASRGTFEALDIESPQSLQMTRLEAGKSQYLGGVELQVFALSHDAAEPTGFRLESPHFSFGFATDLGYWTDDVAGALQGCRVVAVESNYDNEMLQNGPYPRFLKRRISSSNGHLSNDQAGALLRRIAHPNLDCVILAHLSEKNNDPELAVASARRALDDLDVHVVAARRKKPSDVLRFDGMVREAGPRDVPTQGRLF